MYEFPSTGPITADLQIASGLLRVVAEPRDTVTVSVTPVKDNENGRAAAEAVGVEMVGDRLTVTTPNLKGFGFIRRGGDLIIEAHIPAESALEARLASADLIVDGRLTRAHIDSASGDIQIPFVAGDLSSHSASGDSEIGVVGGNLAAESASGDLRIASIGGDAQVRSASGDITIGTIGASSKVNTASGDIRIGSCVRGETRINTASGDVRIGVAEGTAVWLDLNTASGDTHSQLPVSETPPTGTEPTLTLHVRTASGDIAVARAARQPA